MIQSTSGFADDLCRIVGDEFVSIANAADAISGVVPRWVVAPGSAAQVAEVLQLADRAGLHVVARGGGSKIEWGNPPASADVVLSTRRLDRVLEHAAGDMTATVQAGFTVDAFARVLARRGQRLALDPLWPERASVGGIIATDDSGALRASYGTLRDHLIGVTVVLADGTVARSGGKVVKNVAGYDLPKLFIGSFGTLGIIVEATFRLYPCAQTCRKLRFTLPDRSALTRILSALLECALVTSTLQIESRSDGELTIEVLVEGLTGSIEGKVQRVVKAATGSGAAQVDVLADAPCARQALFDADGCVAKVTLLSSMWPTFLDDLHEISRHRGIQWSLVGQVVGMGLLRIDYAQPAALAGALQVLRERLEKLEGTLTIRRCPSGMRGRVDVWPDVGNSLALMQQVKKQFDGNGTLSPGRFVGGI